MIIKCIEPCWRSPRQCPTWPPPRRTAVARPPAPARGQRPPPHRARPDVSTGFYVLPALCPGWVTHRLPTTTTLVHRKMAFKSGYQNIESSNLLRFNLSTLILNTRNACENNASNSYISISKTLSHRITTLRSLKCRWKFGNRVTRPGREDVGQKRK